jgi:hypothetical protein
LLRIAVLICIMLAAVCTTAGDDGPRGVACRLHKVFAGECFSVHGRMTAYNGNPTARIWIVGTHRMLGIQAEEVVEMPEYLAKNMNFETTVYGDFKVCPLTPAHEGRMQFVCIQSAEHLVIRKR